MNWIVEMWWVRFPDERFVRAMRESGLEDDRACYKCGEFLKEGDMLAVISCGFDFSFSGIFHRGECQALAQDAIDEAAKKFIAAEKRGPSE